MGHRAYVVGMNGAECLGVGGEGLRGLGGHVARSNDQL